MKLPDHCPFAAIPESEVSICEIERNDCCRAIGRYWLPEPEEPLCQSRPTQQEAYRFFWDSSFDGNAVVHIWRKDESITLRWQYFWQPHLTHALSLADWQKLQDALEAAEFWFLESVGVEAGLDGAQWLIEGRREDVYQAVRRWSPRGAVYELGRLFFALAGTPLDRVKLY